jgi:hypothetical protein
MNNNIQQLVEVLGGLQQHYKRYLDLFNVVMI